MVLYQEELGELVQQAHYNLQAVVEVVVKAANPRTAAVMVDHLFLVVVLGVLVMVLGEQRVKPMVVVVEVVVVILEQLVLVLQA